MAAWGVSWEGAGVGVGEWSGSVFWLWSWVFVVDGMRVLGREGEGGGEGVWVGGLLVKWDFFEFLLEFLMGMAYGGRWNAQFCRLILLTSIVRTALRSRSLLKVILVSLGFTPPGFWVAPMGEWKSKIVVWDSKNSAKRLSLRSSKLSPTL
jgi:hypothetical protein